MSVWKSKSSVSLHHKCTVFWCTCLHVYYTRPVLRLYICPSVHPPQIQIYCYWQKHPVVKSRTADCVVTSFTWSKVYTTSTWTTITLPITDFIEVR